MVPTTNDNNNLDVEEIQDLNARGSKKKIMCLSFVSCEKKCLGSEIQLKAVSKEDVVPLVSLTPINNISNSSSYWVLHKVNKIKQCVGISCGIFDNQFTTLLTIIEAGHSLETKSRFKKSKE